MKTTSDYEWQAAKASCDETARKYFGTSVSELITIVRRRDQTIAKLKIDLDLMRANCDRLLELNRRRK